MKKALALLLAAVMVLSVFAGCGQNAEPEAPTAESTKETTPVVENVPQEPVEAKTNVERYPIEGSPEITILSHKDNIGESEIYGRLAELVGVKTTYEFATQEQIALLISSEDIPDMIYGTRNDNLSVDKIRDAGEAGLFINFADYWDKIPNLKRLYEEHPEAFNAVMSSDGSFYNIPTYGITLTNNYNSLYFREDHMAKAGWEKAPETIDEFTQFLRDLKTAFADDPDYIPLTNYRADYMDYNNVLSDALYPSFGELVTNTICVGTDGKTVVAGFTTEQYQNYLKYVRYLITEGLMDPNCMTVNSDMMSAFLAEGHSSVNTKLSSLTKDAFESGKLEISVFDPFTSEHTSEKKAYMLPAGAGTFIGAVNAKSENIDACLAFLDAMFAPQDDPLNEEGTFWGISLYIGEKDVAWEWVEEDAVFIRNVPEGYESASQYGSVHGFSTAPYFGTWDKVEVRDGAPRWQQAVIREHRVPYIVDVVTSDGIILNMDEEEVIDDYWPDIKNYINQMNAAFITGQADIEKDFEGYVNNLNAMGLQDVLDAYQSAYDRMSN